MILFNSSYLKFGIGATSISLLLWFTSCLTFKTSKSVSFNEDIRPILNQHCVQCHGGVKRNAGLSLLFRQTALEELESGEKAIVPGKPNQSELYRRIIHEHPEKRMPLDAPSLTEKEVNLLKTWIEEGAEWRPTGHILLQRR